MMFNQNGENGAPTKVALYARVSTEDQAERETIQNQIDIAGTLCPAMGLELVDSYLDDGISGMIPLEQRPEGARLLEDADKGRFKQVVVYGLDRIGRKAGRLFVEELTKRSKTEIGAIQYLLETGQLDWTPVFDKTLQDAGAESQAEEPLLPATQDN